MPRSERTTEQKQIILTYLQGTTSHPTANMVYMQVRKQIPNISKGTVYRNLDFFVEKGLLKEIPGDKKRFDADMSDHGHFICDYCGSIMDIFDGLGDQTVGIETAKKYGEVYSCDIYFHGKCHDCK